jgi:hypothetical protein
MSGFDRYEDGHERLGFGEDLVNQLWPRRTTRLSFSEAEWVSRFRFAAISLAAESGELRSLLYDPPMTPSEEKVATEMARNVCREYQIDGVAFSEAMDLAKEWEFKELP